jgi:uncharacterized protein (TIGR03086 family)
MDVVEAYRRTVDAWQAKVDAVGTQQWADSTPCTEWSVRDLVNHVVGEELWAVPLFEGSTIEEVGDQFDGDVLGVDPTASARAAASAARDVLAEIVAEGGKVHLSYGDEDAAEYAWQLTADHLIHGWDLAKGTGQDPAMDPALVKVVAEWFAGREQLYRDSGAIADRATMTGDPQSDLLAAFGRSADWAAPAVG